MYVEVVYYNYGVILRLHPTVPSAAVLSDTTSPSSTAITITGSVPSGSVVTGFEVRWQRDTSVGCSNEDEDTISETGVFFTLSYQISGLEPGNRYTITVTVSSAAGTAPASNSVTGTTLEIGERDRPNQFLLCCVFLSTAPSAGPASVTAGTVTANSITVQWEEVPCLHRNGEITGYTVVARTSGEVVKSVDVDADDGREVTVSGLNPNTQYSVIVAAVNSAGTSPATSIDIEIPGERVCGSS